MNKNEVKNWYNKRLVILMMAGAVFMCFVEKISPHPKYAKVFYHLGLESQKNNKITDAIYYFKKAIQFNPTFPLSYNQLGLIYQSLGNHRRAIEYFQKAISSDPEFFEGFGNLGISYLNTGNNDKAIECLRTSVQHYMSYQFWYYLGVAYVKGGYKKKALEIVSQFESQNQAQLSDKLYDFLLHY